MRYWNGTHTRRAGIKIKGEIDEINAATVYDLTDSDNAQMIMGLPEEQRIDKIKDMPIANLEPKPIPDIGFKVFKLDTSNLNLWDGIPVGVDNGQKYFDKAHNVIDGVKDDRPAIDVVYELMLKLGVPLTCEVEEKDIEGKTVYPSMETCSCSV